MASPFVSPNRNVGYNAPKSPYENQWAVSARDYKLKQQGISTPALPAHRSASPPVKLQAVKAQPHSQRVELQEVAQKTPKQVREWMREQVALLEDSSSD